LTQDGVLETANGKSRVYKGGTVSLTEQDYAHNAHLFVPEPPPVGMVLEPRKPTDPIVPASTVRHTPKAEPVRQMKIDKAAVASARASAKRR
jgi:hypothetical protein